MQPSFLRGMRQDIHKKEYKKRNRINSFLKERVMGIEPTYPAWKAGVLPLNYTRTFVLVRHNED